MTRDGRPCRNNLIKNRVAVMQCAERRFSRFLRPWIDMTPGNGESISSTQANDRNGSPAWCRCQSNYGVVSGNVEHARPGRSGSPGGEFEGRSRFEDFYQRVQRMIAESFAEPVDCVERRGRYVVESSPVIRDEIPRLETLEKRQCVLTGKVSFPESRLPPRCVTDGQQCEIQVAAFGQQILLDEMSRPRSQSRIAGKEARC